MGDCTLGKMSFELPHSLVQGCHTGHPEAFWRANRAGRRAALSITPYMNRAGTIDREITVPNLLYCSNFSYYFPPTSVVYRDFVTVT
jgi:hypothetical protein